MEVSFTATIAATVETFDEAAYASNLATELNVTVADISLAVTAASVRVVATVRVAAASAAATSAAAAAVETAIAALVAAPADVASDRLGVTVEQIEEPITAIVVVQTPLLPPPPPSAPSTPAQQLLPSVPPSPSRPPGMPDVDVGEENALTGEGGNSVRTTIITVIIVAALVLLLGFALLRLRWTEKQRLDELVQSSSRPGAATFAPPLSTATGSCAAATPTTAPAPVHVDLMPTPGRLPVSPDRTKQPTPVAEGSTTHQTSWPAHQQARPANSTNYV